MSEKQKPTMPDYRRQLLVCVGTHCSTQGMDTQGLRALGGELIKHGLLEGEAQPVKPTMVRCLGACGSGPIMCVHPEAVWYFDVTPQRFARIAHEHLKEGRVVDEYVFHKGPTA